MCIRDSHKQVQTSVTQYYSWISLRPGIASIYRYIAHAASPCPPARFRARSVGPRVRTGPLDPRAPRSAPCPANDAWRSCAGNQHQGQRRRRYIVWSSPTLHPRRPWRPAMTLTLSPFSVTYACSCHVIMHCSSLFAPFLACVVPSFYPIFYCILCPVPCLPVRLCLKFWLL